MRAKQFLEANLGTNPKRPARPGSRPERGHLAQERYTQGDNQQSQMYDPELTDLDQFTAQHYPGMDSKQGFNKFVQRSLMHAKQSDEHQNERLDNIEQTLRKLASNQSAVAEGPDELDKYDTHGLQGYYSDFHKDLHGFRPRHHSEEEFNNPERLKELIRGLHKYMDALKATPEGRAQLKADGWHFDDEVDEGGFPTPLMPSHPLNPLNPLSPTYVAKSRENLDMDKVTARAKAMFAKGMTEEQVKAELIKQGVAERLANQAVQMGQMNESKKQKQDAPKPRNFVAKNAINTGAGAHKDKKKAEKQGDTKHKKNLMDLAEMEDLLEKASRQLCKSSTPDEDLGASNLASCKSQGLRARDGEKSHLIGHGSSKVRIKVGGKRIKGKKYGGPLPDYGTRKGQK